MKLVCYMNPSNARSRAAAQAMAEGARRIGWKAVCETWDKKGVQGDVAAAYGWWHPEILEAYRAVGGHFLHIDLGYWGRKPDGDPLGGYHKVALDGRNPMAFRKSGMAPDRFMALGVELKPWRQDGQFILLAGMSAKSAWTYGLAAHAWEEYMTDAIRSLSDIPIIFRPKPSYADAKPITGTAPANIRWPIDHYLKHAWIVIAHHSNVAINGLAEGVPCHVVDGPALALSTGFPEILEKQHMPHFRERDQLFFDLAWCQWKFSEIASGDCLVHMLERTALCV